MDQDTAQYSTENAAHVSRTCQQHNHTTEDNQLGRAQQEDPTLTPIIKKI